MQGVLSSTLSSEDAGIMIGKRRRIEDVGRDTARFIGVSRYVRVGRTVRVKDQELGTSPQIAMERWSGMGGTWWMSVKN